MESQSLCFLLFLFPFLFFVFKAFTKWKKTKDHNRRPKLPPGPTKLPLIGNLHLFIGTLPHRCLRDLAKKHGSVMNLQLGEISTVVISSPEAAQQVMQTHDVNFADRPYSLGASILTYNFSDILFAPYGDYWRQLRKICTLELLSMKRVQSFRHIREEEVADFIRQISSKAGSPVNLRKRLRSLSYSIISRAAFGAKYKDQDDFTTLVQEELTDALGGFNVGDIFPSLKLLHVISGATAKFKMLQHKIDKILENIIDEHRARKESSTSCSKEANDLVHVLLNLQDHGDLKIPLTDSTLKAVILDMFAGGGETTSTTLEWAMSEILKNPRVLKKAQTEVRQLFGSKGDVNEEGLRDLKYLKFVVKETLRLHPPGPLLVPRESRERCEINGYDIPAKTKVIINAWAIGRDPNYWAEADKFYPERFHDSSIDFKGANFEFIPFGAGRRICPAMSLGIANIELPLANLLYHFDWKFYDGRKLEDINMTEVFALSVTRKYDLCLVPIPYRPMLID
ncbi:premnaspirodiene oxygenase-like [Durio zibethinus]|uniref:Premnaspirodiene oxygenase-like n=1 Tax=Durio zibethinus TaxID=66656 RepID=A0A6P5WQH7_DURZI|nr:premnaspirodiene oxygenase-like [Durio zibethinus]